MSPDPPRTYWLFLSFLVSENLSKKVWLTLHSFQRRLYWSYAQFPPPLRLLPVWSLSIYPASCLARIYLHGPDHPSLKGSLPLLNSWKIYCLNNSSGNESCSVCDISFITVWYCCLNSFFFFIHTVVCFLFSQGSLYIVYIFYSSQLTALNVGHFVNICWF